MRAICDILPKLIITETSYSQEANLNQTVPNFEKIRNKIITDLFLKMNLTCNMETINNINNACIEILENRNVLEFVLADETILRHIFKNLSFNLNLEENSELSSYNYKEILVLLLNLLRNSIVDNITIPRDENKTSIDNSDPTKPLDIKSSFLGELILEYLTNILDNFIMVDVSSSIVETTFSVSTRVFGIRRYLFFYYKQFLFFYFKINCFFI